MSHCRSCGTAIFWLTHTANETRMPVDAIPHDDGTIAPLSWDYTLETHVVDAIDQASHYEILSAHEVESARVRRPAVALYRSHFATCPRAAAHRRSR